MQLAWLRGSLHCFGMAAIIWLGIEECRLRAWADQQRGIGEGEEFTYLGLLTVRCLSKGYHVSQRTVKRAEFQSPTLSVVSCQLSQRGNNGSE